MTYKDYKITKTENGKYEIITPAGATLAIPARSLEAAKIQADCHRERRFPTEAERRILHPELHAPTPYPNLRPRHSTTVVFGNRVFVRR